jgi:hypothetical protein
MKFVMSPKIFAVAAVTIVLSATVAQAQTGVRLRAAFDRSAQLVGGGRAVKVGGPLGECPAGDVITLSVTVTRGHTAARGNWPKPHACTGNNQRWQLTAHTAGGSRLGPGQATGRGTVVIKRDGRTIATVRWHRTITLKRAA